MKRKNNASRPIEVEDSDEERGEMNDEAELENTDHAGLSRKRRRLSRSPTSDLRIEEHEFDFPASPPVFGEVQARECCAESSHNKDSSPNPAELLLNVLEILPEICPKFALKELCTEIEEGRVGRPVEKVVEMALEMVFGYPKVGDTKEKAKEVQISGVTNYLEGNYRKGERTGKGYRLLSLIALEESFPRMPVPQYVNHT